MSYYEILCRKQQPHRCQQQLQLNSSTSLTLSNRPQATVIHCFQTSYTPKLLQAYPAVRNRRSHTWWCLSVHHLHRLQDWDLKSTCEDLCSPVYNRLEIWCAALHFWCRYLYGALFGVNLKLSRSSKWTTEFLIRQSLVYKSTWLN